MAVAVHQLLPVDAQGEPLELMADQAHHQAALVAQAPLEGQHAFFADNRRKLDDEVARILD